MQKKDNKPNRRVQARVCAEDLREVASGYPTRTQGDSSVSEVATSESIPDTDLAP